MSDPTSDAAQSSPNGTGVNGTVTVNAPPAPPAIAVEHLSDESIRRLQSIASGAIASGATTGAAAPPPVMPALPSRPSAPARPAPVVLTPGVEEAMAARAAADAPASSPAGSAVVPAAPDRPAAGPEGARMTKHDAWDAPEGWSRGPRPPYLYRPDLAARYFDCAPLVGVLLGVSERSDAATGVKGYALRFLLVRDAPATTGPGDDLPRVIDKGEVVMMEATHEMTPYIEAARHPTKVCELHVKPVVRASGAVTVVVTHGRLDIPRDILDPRRNGAGAARAMADAPAGNAKPAAAGAK